LGICLVFLAGGCVTTTNEIKPLTDNQLRGVFSNARDARNFWITVYRSGNRSVQFSGANRVHPEQIAERNFLWESASNTPIIKVDNAREETFNALVDTTAARSWFDFATFQRVKAIPLGPPAYDCTPRNVNDNMPGYACVLTKMRFDQLHMENALFHFRAATGPLGYLARGEDHPAPDAILGCDLIKAFAFVRINYPKRKIIFSSTMEYSPEGTNVIAALPLKELEGAFAADGAVDGEKKVLILDSAGDFEVAMDNPPSDTLKQISVGDLVFRNVSVVDSKNQSLGILSHPRIGRQLLSKFNITFVPKKKLVYFERPGDSK
jgi:hypothetical protein